eukprot:6209190-Pleurochrysis_carterae.AAC.1
MFTYPSTSGIYCATSVNFEDIAVRIRFCPQLIADHGEGGTRSRAAMIQLHILDEHILLNFATPVLIVVARRIELKTSTYYLINDFYFFYIRVIYLPLLNDMLSSLSTTTTTFLTLPQIVRLRRERPGAFPRQTGGGRELVKKFAH